MLRWITVALLILWIIAMTYAVLHVVWRGWASFFRSKRQNKTPVNAKVKNKQARQEFDPVHWHFDITQKVLIFECADGIERDYEVHDDIFDWVEIGDDGVLTYQGDMFVRFDARHPRHDPSKLYKKLTRA